ncbi:hypothetical protein IWW50_006169, partial [Coemansia erecta]
PLLVLSPRTAADTGNALGAAAPTIPANIRHSHSFGNGAHSSPLAYPPFSMDAFADSLVPMTPPSTSGMGSRNRNMLALPASDPRYNSHTVAARSGEHRRAHMHRRKTESVENAPRIQRPATAHASTTSRKVTYSQYPDFETIKDPFAKRDKIPRRSEHPFISSTGSANAPPLPPALMSNEQGARGGGSRNVPQTPVSAPILHPEDHAVPELSDSLERRRETQLSAPTPLRSHDRIPRHSQPEPTSEPLQMESLEMQFPESPVTPKQQTAASTQDADKPPLPPKATALLSPATPGFHSRLGRVPASPHSVVVIPPRRESRPANIEMESLKSPARTIGGHNISPRLQIDMNNVDKLYARRSLIFENKMKRESKDMRSIGRMRSPLAATPEEAALHRHESLSRPPTQPTVSKTANRQSYSSEYDDDDDDKESDDYIPFDQVLIPTAFKRLRTALEDPAFEVDEETYHRFKLSERWYARENQRQTERTAKKASSGASKKRQAVPQDPLPDVGAKSRAPTDDGVLELDSLHEQLTHAEPDLEPTAIPTRTRTASKQQQQQQRIAHDSALDVHQRMSYLGDNDYRASDSTARTIPSGYVPPPTPVKRYADSQQLATDMHLNSHELQDLHAGKSRDRR